MNEKEMMRQHAAELTAKFLTEGGRIRRVACDISGIDPKVQVVIAQFEKKQYAKTCACGIAFTTTVRPQRYCTTDCRMRSNSGKKKDAQARGARSSLNSKS